MVILGSTSKSYDATKVIEYNIVFCIDTTILY